MSRRLFLKAAGLFSLGAGELFGAASARARSQMSTLRVAVVGAGALGGWSALHLLRRGARVTLIDAWGPGNARASSGGETRIIRATYGPDPVYVEMVARSLELWRENERKWNRRLYHPCGCLWMAGEKDDYEKAALPLLRSAGLRFDELTVREAQGRFPQFDFEGVRWLIYEHDAGYLLARQACAAVVAAFRAEGGDYRKALVTAAATEERPLTRLRLSDGSFVEADQYVFACGPWLGTLFPDVIGRRITPTRQEVFYFGTEAGDGRFDEDVTPVWIDNGETLFYGIPGNEWRGFKLADDTRGPEFDPTTGDRTPSAAAVASARLYLERRFPGLKGAPLLEARVCQYENSPDGHFIIDRHPEVENICLVGGGSGHGFKHGPALGERLARHVLGESRVDPFFSLSRFADKS